MTKVLSIGAWGGAAALLAMQSLGVELVPVKEDDIEVVVQTRKPYTEFCGPMQPLSRQMRRLAARQEKKAILRDIGVSRPITKLRKEKNL